MSVLLRPDLPVERVPLLCLAAAVAVVRSVGGEARIKWPNDVLVRGKKLAGILATTRGKNVVVGIGLNLVSHPLAVQATDLSTLGMPADPVSLAVAIRDELLGLSSGLGHSVEPLLNAWRSLSCTLGAQVRIGQVQGQAIDIDEYGGLLVLGAEGMTRVLAGDVEMVSDMGR